MPDPIPKTPQVLSRLILEALSELPVRVQIRLYREAGLPPDSRPFLVVGGEAAEEAVGAVAEWLTQHGNALILGLMRHHGLDADRIALLNEFGKLGPPPRPTSAHVRISFGDAPSGASKLNLHEASVATALLLELDTALGSAFELVSMPRSFPEVQVRSGSFIAELGKGSAATAGLLVIFDAITGGATLPITGPVYAKFLLGSALAAPSTVNFVTDQFSKLTNLSTSRAKMRAETKEIEMKGVTNTLKTMKEIEKMAAEIDLLKENIAPGTAKTMAETEKLSAEAAAGRAKIVSDLARAQAEIMKMQAEATKIMSEVAKVDAVLATPGSAARGDGLDQGTPWLSVPASMVSQEKIVAVSKRHDVGAPVVALALNAGLPRLMQAQAAGMQVTLVPPGEPDADKSANVTGIETVSAGLSAIDEKLHRLDMTMDEKLSRLEMALDHYLSRLATTQKEMVEALASKEQGAGGLRKGRASSPG